MDDGNMLHGTRLEVVFGSQQKQKKPHLADKNIKACVDFARVHEHHVVDDGGRVIFSYESTINRLFSYGMSC